MNHTPTHEVYFNDGSVEAVEGTLPPTVPMFVVAPHSEAVDVLPPERTVVAEPADIKVIDSGRWWNCTLLRLDEDKVTYSRYGEISINVDNVLFIKKI